MNRNLLIALTVISILIEVWAIIFFGGILIEWLERGRLRFEGMIYLPLLFAGLFLGFNLYLLAATRGFERWSELPRIVRIAASIGWTLALVFGLFFFSVFLVVRIFVS